METDLPDAEHPEKEQGPQNDHLPPDGVKEGAGKEGAVSEMKKRKLDDDARGSADASNLSNPESGAKRKRIPIPVPGTKLSDVMRSMSQVYPCTERPVMTISGHCVL